ncbi:lycopene cyclase family protein [Candidatus Pelagibacter sp.]|jgi:lycopene beta-cyclase|nr:lycopene cyclase family protein [Candidatus Pelagibacter sp.]
MKEFDYIIIGGGCAGLSLAYELDLHSKLKDKTLAIVEHRDEYKRDKTWSFWKVSPHNFEDCTIKSWDNFTINIPSHLKHVDCKNMPYQTIDSGLFYQKIIDKIKQNNNIYFFKNINEVNTENSFIFNSVGDKIDNKSSLWQHFSGIEIETSKDFFDEKIFNLMDFDCDQKNSVHFFYTLPFSKTKALIETTWISDLNNTSLNDYDIQLKDYIEDKLKIKNYKINYKETGAIPLFHPNNIKKLNQIEIGTAGGMTRLSTGYTFLNIQEQSKYIRKNIENIKDTKIFSIERKYEFLDNIFLKVLKKNPERMAQIFYKMFNSSPNTVINFLSNKSNILEDISIISKMPKWVFLKQLF